jgi:hypothetical protein
MACELAEADNLWEMLGHELEARGLGTPKEIGAAFEMPPDEATALLARDRWQKGNVTLLEAAAAQLGVQMPKPASDR